MAARAKTEMSITEASPAVGVTHPAASPDPAAMSLDQVQAELRGYAPGTARDVVALPDWARRRVALWRRLDRLTKPDGAPSAA
jgi:hypothetical protein